MSYFDHEFSSDDKGLRSVFARFLETPFDIRQRRLAQRIEALRAMDDAELAAYGLTRDTIVAHVFATDRRI
ncbi:hypothetical protein KUH32_00550 [Thalassococcus sp. CAU 1522]|uniref:DUF1127 domain-containing protein n=1 Tax=Thalassococcus arenae TaxID=2851652 RepID=A0ABS6N2K0_9RHOB|nr:hypothetical protein [Thalassococcus arenae]MBV2358250.1 hypothetical protein [Thalassococcus arenae]